MHRVAQGRLKTYRYLLTASAGRLSTPRAMSTTPLLNAQGLPIRSALKTEDDVTRTPPSGPMKAVHIAEPEPLPADEPLLKRQFSASMSGRRLSGRPAISSANSSRPSFISQTSIDTLDLNGYQSASSLSQTTEDAAAQESQEQQGSHHHHSHRIDRVSEKLLAQVADWLQREKTKRESRKPRKHHHHHHHHLRRRHSKAQPVEAPIAEEQEQEPEVEITLQRTTSIDSNSSDVSLDRLQRILDDSMAALGLNSIPHFTSKLGRRPSYRRKVSSRVALQLSRAASSDTDFVDGDVLVPSCDAVLDNTKTLKYSQANLDDAASVSSRREEKERQAWTTFKNEIIRLAHTLRLKGWRRVSLDSGDDISVQRLSGALTNAVYVVTPPENLTSSSEHVSKKKPPKLLLRIYGPQVEQLIDRDNELSILKRLARKKIGPRLLGTFTNGRFEQFFNAVPLTPGALREPETSKQIAKRMRELHEGIDLLQEEKVEGPTVFKNWDSWVNNVEQRTLFLDQQISRHDPDSPSGSGEAWKKRGFVCGVEWPKFKAMVDKYRDLLNESYGGPEAMREKLVFAHNDTQYGNILRVRPDDEKSPLLHPENEHKQLIVIDFEYASANLPGLEFANHFTEWAYNYHDATTSYACNVDRYPTPEQQRRFIKAYVDHRPKLTSTSSAAMSSANSDLDITPTATPLSPPAMGPTPSSSIVEFMLDARVPPGGWKEEESRAAELSEERVRELMRETRLWRAMNSAQWVAWGIVQAKIAGYSKSSDGEEAPLSPATVSSEGTLVTGESGGANGSISSGKSEEEGFDYLSYAHERALFFWGDCVRMGVVKLEELPEGLRQSVKIIDY